MNFPPVPNGGLSARQDQVIRFGFEMDRMRTNSDATFAIIRHGDAGKVIGPSGATIWMIQSDTGATKIRIAKADPFTTPPWVQREILILGTEAARTKAVEAINKIISESLFVVCDGM